MLGAYTTAKEVLLLDRRLGVTYLLILLLVLGYVFGIRLVVEKGYQSLELNQGMVAITLDGESYTTTNGIVQPVDQADLVAPLKEGAALFLATSKTVTPQQSLGNCTDPQYACENDSDCVHDPPLSYGICDSGYCVLQKWCPSPNAAGSSTSTAVLEGLDRLAITLAGTINFPHLAPSTLSTEDGRNARVTWSIPEVLQRGGVDSVEVLTQGAVLSLVLKWSCNLGISGGFSLTCLPRLNVYDIGPKDNAFAAEWANYYHEVVDGTPVLHRDYYNATGIRFLVSSRGSARKIDPYACIMQLFVLLALLPLANNLADALMQNFFSERRHYREYKTEVTAASEVRGKADQLDQHFRSQQEKLLSYGERDQV